MLENYLVDFFVGPMSNLLKNKLRACDRFFEFKKKKHFLSNFIHANTTTYTTEFLFLSFFFFLNLQEKRPQNLQVTNLKMTQK